MPPASRWRNVPLVPADIRHRQLNSAAVILFGFLVALFVGTVLLMLPASTVNPGGLPLLPALFTATSALCVTGLAIVDTATYWTTFGKVVIAVLIQVGGFGVMSFATILGQAVVRKANLSANVISAVERRTAVGGIAPLLRRVLLVSIVVEALVALALTARFVALGYPLPRALGHGVFHAVSAFNNAGFALYSDNMTSFVGDWWVCVPIMAAIIIGGLGFPVLFQFRRDVFHLHRWTLNTRMVVAGTLFLLCFSTATILAMEWNNPRTLGGLPASDAVLAGLFQAVQTRTSGFNSVDIGGMHEPTLFAMDLFMFVGAGPAGTAGGVKITTVLVLVAAVSAVVRGRTQPVMLGKGVPVEVVHQAITVVMLSGALVVAATFALLALTPFHLSEVLFEVLSAFGTVGLSTGITPHLDAPSLLVIIFMMIVGRLGPITVATAFAFAEPASKILLPYERPIIG